MPKIRRLGALLLAIGLPVLMVGLGLAIAGFSEIQDILADESPDEGAKDRAETNLYVATAGTFFLSAGAVATTVGGVLLGLTSTPSQGSPPGRL